MIARRWLLFAAALLAGFQAWLWLYQSWWVAGLASGLLALVLLAVAVRPSSRIGSVVTRVWNPPQRPGETERRYRFRIGLTWLLVAGIVPAAVWFIPPSEASPEGELRETYISIGSILFVVLSLLMSGQSFLRALLARPVAATPNNSLERTREP